MNRVARIVMTKILIRFKVRVLSDCVLQILL